MSIRTAAETFCNKVQRFIGEGNPATLRTPVGFLQALYTEPNLQGGEQVQSDFDARSGRAVVSYRNFYQRGAGVDGVKNADEDGNPNLCEPVDQKPIYTTSFEFDLDRDTEYHQITLSDAEFRQYCNDETKDSELEKIIQSNLNDFYLKVNRRLLAYYAAGIGGYVGGGPVKSGSAFVGGNIDVSLNSIVDVVRREFEEMERSEQPFMVGWGNLKEFFRKAQFGCCNTNVGVNVDEASDYGRFFQDLSVPGVFAPNNNRFLAFMPGAVVPMEFSNNGGDFLYEPQSEKGNSLNFNSFDDLNTTIVDRTNNFNVPFEFDIFVRRSNCSRNATWTLTLMKTISLLFTMPPDAFATGDRLIGTNGALLFDATSA